MPLSSDAAAETTTPVAPEGSTLVDFDHFDSQVIDDPYPVWQAMRSTPGAWSPHYGGFHVLCRYADVMKGGADTATLSSAQGVNIPALPFPPFIPLEVDPPNHRDYRRILNVPMAPDRVKQDERWIRSLAVDLLEQIKTDEEIDLVKSFAAPFPKTVALRLVGYPTEDLQRIDNWVEHIVGEHKEREGAAELAAEFFGYLQQFVVDRRAADKQDDLMDALINGELNGEPFDDQTIIQMLLLLTFGGLHTTTSAIAGMLLWLADHPEERTTLRENSSLIPTAVDEFIRYTSPVNQMARTAVVDSSLGGCPIKPGDKVLLAYGAANRDPDAFENPNEVALDRFPNRHLSFGAGVHRCVGSHYAKLMVRVALEETLRLLGAFSVEDRSKLLWTGGEARGLRALPIVRETD